MALQKRNRLITAHLIVLVFWFVVLFVATHGFDLKALSERMTYASMVMLGGALCGILLWLTFDISRRGGLLERNGNHSFRGAVSTIGDIPLPKQPKRGRISEAVLTKRFPWWPRYREAHQAHAEAFLAILGVMASVPKLPASPVPGGHGGASLIDHSFNVVETLLQMAPGWSYQGHKNKKGEISFPLLDTAIAEYRFNMGDPILVLTAFAHDIGKVACYQMKEDGSVSEVRKNHDIEGAKILRTLPEVMALAWDDRVALLTACEYYHHIGSLPYCTWLNDRARALVELLIAADIATGQREGRVITNEYEDIPYLPEPAVEAKEAAGEAPAGDDDDGDEGVTVQERPATSALADLHGSALDLTFSVLIEPNRVNGTNSAARVAWKHGDWLYIQDAKLRSAVAEKTGDSDYAKPTHRGVMHPFTYELLAKLSADQNLLQEHNNRKFTAKSSLFTTKSSIAGKTPVETRFVIVARTRAFPGLENRPDCKAAPIIEACSWGEAAAINKNSIDDEMKGEDADEEISEVGLVKESGSPVDPRALLLEAVENKTIPYQTKEVDGISYHLFEEDILKEEYPDVEFVGEGLIRPSGGKSKKCFIGVRK